MKAFKEMMLKHVLDLIFQQDEQTTFAVCNESSEGSAGTIFGGYVRSLLAKESFRDIDVKISSQGRELLINKLKETYIVELEHANILTYGTCGCITILVRHRTYSELTLKMDLVSSENTNMIKRDFDVNQLELCGDQISCFKAEYLPSITEHIRRKEFVIMDSKEGPTLEHPTDKSCCIQRSGKNGIKLLERIERMEARGWKCLNRHICSNPQCICATKESIETFRRKKRELSELGETMRWFAMSMSTEALLSITGKKDVDREIRMRKQNSEQIQKLKRVRNKKSKIGKKRIPQQKNNSVPLEVFEISVCL